ncbi:MAG TPA: TonB-dependent receptor, partial [Chitinispirillaceae bacterium]|nr:TonB-dependent receptor [Chitinispirillaceae bacterium]
MIKRAIIHQLLLSLSIFYPLFAQIEIIEEDSSIVLQDTAVSAADADADLLLDTDSTAGALEKEPELKTFIKASYPDSCIAKGIEGTVSFELLINENGNVDSLKIIKRLHPLLDSLAEKAVSKFIFSPGFAGGKPVPVSLIYDYRFTIDEIIDETDEFINISGKVIEKGTRKPLADAVISLTVGDTAAELADSGSAVSVKTRSGVVPLKRYLEKIGSYKGQSLEGRSIITTTDTAGNFVLKSIPAGIAYLKIVATGFEPNFTDLEVNDSEEIKLKIYIDPVAIDEYEITVYGKAEQKEITQRTLQAREAKRVPGFSGDAVKAVQALPGVARPVFGSTEIVLRGADWDDNKYYIDGVEIPYLWHDIGNNSVINSNIIDNVALYPSSFGAKYGDALGGVIEVETRKAKEKVHLIADMNLSYSSLVLDLPISKKLSFTGSVRREYYMTIMSYVLKKFDFDLNLKMYYWDYSLRMDYAPTSDHNIFCEFIQSKDILEMSSIDGTDDQSNLDYNKGFKLGVAGWDWKISKTWENSFRYGLSPVSNGIGMGMENIAFKQKVSGYEHTVRDELHWEMTSKIKTTVGLDLHLEPTDIDYSFKGQYNSSKNLTLRDTSIATSLNFLNGSIGGYLSFAIKPVDNLTITPEYRLDYYPGLNYHGSLLPELWNYKEKPTFRWSCEPSLRINTRYKMSDVNTFKGAAGTYNKSPGYYALKEPWGNPGLEPARGTQYTLGYERQLTDLISLDISGYLNQQWDKAHYMDEFERGDQYDEGINVNRGKARMRGL